MRITSHPPEAPANAKAEQVNLGVDGLSDDEEKKGNAVKVCSFFLIFIAT
jgi:hypothetical protein